MAYGAADSGSLPARPGAIRPVHVADLLSREGHPLAAQLFAAREAIKRHAAAKNPESVTSARRTLGMAAGALLVVGTVVASALGLNDSASPPAAAAGEPIGALPGHGSTGQPVLAPIETADEQPTGPSSADVAPVALPAPVAPVADAPPIPSQGVPRIGGVPTTKPPPTAAPIPAKPAQNPPRPVTEPVGQTGGQVSGTLQDVVAPVADLVDDTLTPALSLIDGLLGR